MKTILEGYVYIILIRIISKSKEKYVKHKDGMDCTVTCQINFLSQTFLSNSKFYIPEVNSSKMDKFHASHKLQ